MELADKDLRKSCFCFPRADRKRGVSLGSSLIPAVSRYFPRKDSERIKDDWEISLVAPILDATA